MITEKLDQVTEKYKKTILEDSLISTNIFEEWLQQFETQSALTHEELDYIILECLLAWGHSDNDELRVDYTEAESYEGHEDFFDNHFNVFLTEAGLKIVEHDDYFGGLVKRSYEQ